MRIALFAVSVGLAVLVDSVVPHPYMDEIFHIPQTERYLAGDFGSWDPKITTPPFLYVVGAAAAYLPTRFAPLATVAILRGMNVVIHTLTLVILTEWLHPFWPAAVALFLLPPLFFCQFLFYTDALSTLLVLLTFFLVCGAHRYGNLALLHLSALTAAAATVTRQTNIVWAAFSAGTYVLLTVNAARASDAIEWRCLAKCGVGVAIRRCFLYIALAVAFGGAVCINGGLALGDRSNHAVRLHLAQLVYFFAFFAAFTPGYALHLLRSRNIWRCWWVVVAIAWVPCAVVALRYSSYAHPFVLSDNRHAVFYLWRRLLGHATRRYWLLVPASAVGVFTAAACLDGFSALLRFVFIICTVATIATCPLIECRYFIVPHMFLYFMPLLRPAAPGFLFRRDPHLLNAMWATIVNVLVLFLFVFRPFTAPDGSVGRFMW